MLFFPYFFSGFGFFPGSCDFSSCDWRQEYSATLKIIFLLYFLTGWRNNGNTWDLNSSISLSCFVVCFLLFGFVSLGFVFVFFSFRKTFWTSNLSTWSILLYFSLQCKLGFHSCLGGWENLRGQQNPCKKLCGWISGCLHTEKGISLLNVPRVIAWIKAMLRFFFKNGIF